MTHDYSAFVEEPKNEDHRKLNGLVERQFNIEKNIARLEMEMERAKEELKLVQEKLIPEQMADMGVEEFTSSSGLKVKIKKTIFASLPKDPAQRAQALDWLERNGHASIIKDSFSIKYNKNEHDKADKTAEMLVASGVDFERKLDVHAQTLSAFLREQIREGEDVPLEIFGAHPKTTSEISTKK